LLFDFFTGRGMIGNTQEKRVPKTVWATVGATKELQGRHKSRGVGVHAGLRSKGVDKKIPREGIDDWCYRSIELVAKPLRSNAANQRRIRYFGFETTHEQDKK
jgi:hypothetical protein